MSLLCYFSIYLFFSSSLPILLLFATAFYASFFCIPSARKSKHSSQNNQPISFWFLDGNRVCRCANRIGYYVTVLYDVCDSVNFASKMAFEPFVFNDENVPRINCCVCAVRCVRTTGPVECANQSHKKNQHRPAARPTIKRKKNNNNKYSRISVYNHTTLTSMINWRSRTVFRTSNQPICRSGERKIPLQKCYLYWPFKRYIEKEKNDWNFYQLAIIGLTIIQYAIQPTVYATRCRSSKTLCTESIRIKSTVLKKGEWQRIEAEGSKRFPIPTDLDISVLQW